MNTDTFDYIVVGAGSGGAAAAARLSESGKHSVLLLEAGPRDTNILTKIPLGVAEVLGRGIYLRDFFTEPDPQLHDRKIYWPRGWATGGSSTVNGMVWVHGTPHLFDEWASDGCPGWSYDDLRPWFRKIETYQGGDSAYRGSSGPMTITEFQSDNSLADDFLDALEVAHVGKRVKDYNAGGFGGSKMQMNTRNGVRCNTRMAYLDPAEGRSNLTVMTETLVTRIRFEGKRAVGLLARSAGREVLLNARREVILCGGAFNTPQLLELSGVGQRAVLEAAGVPLLHELPMVGENLSEHVYSPVAYRTRPGVSWNRTLNSLFGKAGVGLRYLTRRDGPLSSNSLTAQAFVPAQSGGHQADIKLQIQQISTSNNRNKGKLAIDGHDGVTIASFQIRPHSRGSSHITSADAAANPRLISNHFTDHRDVNACLTALKMTRRLAEAAPLAKWILSEERPGAVCASDEALVDYLRATGATAWHPVGTCRIGNDPSQSVVDPELRVHGVQGLRIADGSAMPTIASTNTNAICIVMGERVADFIARTH